MEILSHRGFWETPQEKNSIAAFERSFGSGFGIETDIRDCNGQLVISHDMAGVGSILLAEMLNLYKTSNCTGTLALNIKADGLQDALKKLLIVHDIERYFVFDMSIPDTLGFLKGGMRYFTRQSEYEPSPALYDKADGVWMDMFISDWIRESDIDQHLKAGKKACIVSPELHKRDHLPFWEKLSKFKNIGSDVLLCTDHPIAAKEFFSEKN